MGESHWEMGKALNGRWERKPLVKLQSSGKRKSFRQRKTREKDIVLI